MSDVEKAQEERWWQKRGVGSYEEYCTIDVPVEVIDRTVYEMPSRTANHQLILGGLFTQIATQLLGKPYEPFLGPVDVKLPAKTINSAGEVLDFTIVQPDLIIVCDKNKLHEEYVDGTPDFIVEILDPSTWRKDTVEKLHKYAKVGVKEYWMIDPANRTVNIALLGEEGVYTLESMKAEETVALKTFEGLHINFDHIFAWVN